MISSLDSTTDPSLGLDVPKPPPATEQSALNGAENRWIEFREFKAPPGHRTRRWAVCPKGTLKAIGFIIWYSPWRKYCFHPNAGTVYEWDCLRDIANFCSEQTREHRKAANKKS